MKVSLPLMYKYTVIKQIVADYYMFTRLDF